MLSTDAKPLASVGDSPYMKFTSFIPIRYKTVPETPVIIDDINILILSLFSEERTIAIKLKVVNVGIYPCQIENETATAIEENTRARQCFEKLFFMIYTEKTIDVYAMV